MYNRKTLKLKNIDYNIKLDISFENAATLSVKKLKYMFQFLQSHLQFSSSVRIMLMRLYDYVKAN